jgi:hypothetical protein
MNKKRLQQKLFQNYFVQIIIPAFNDDSTKLVILGEKLQNDENLLPNIKAEFTDMATKVAAAKNVMDPIAATKDGKESLGKILRIVDCYKGLRTKIIREKNGQVVTNAWLKMYEILCQLGLIEYASKDSVLLFGNAELPGSFMCACNQYIKTVARAELKWVASSLYPDDVSLVAVNNDTLGDQHGLYACNKQNWLMDAPNMQGEGKMRNNGDVTIGANLVNLAFRAEERLGGKPQLYTADAGIDVSNDFSDQERLNLKIHYGQALGGLLSLQLQGCIVLKHYTITLPFTISLVVVLSCLFKELYITKPMTSRPTNSETYIVGKGFKGITDAQKKSLLWHIDNFDVDRPLVPLGIDKVQETIAAILRAGRMIHKNQQIEFLKEAIDLHTQFSKDTNSLQRMLNRPSYDAEQNWLRLNPVYPITAQQQILQRISEKECGKPAK